AHVLGYVGAAEPMAHGGGLGEMEGDVAGGIVGRSGAELSAQRWLRGTAGQVRRDLDSRGRTVDSVVARPPRAGRDVILTLDTSLERVAERLLDEFQRK